MAMENENGNSLVITRVFDAPREEVWKAWTDPEIFKAWWGPEGFTSSVSKMEVEVGGKYLNVMHGPGMDGIVRDFWSTGVFKEITEPERLVMTDSFADENGNAVPASHYGMSAEFPMEMTVTVEFENENGRTKMTLTQAGMPATEQVGARQGWGQSFDKLAKVLKKS